MAAKRKRTFAKPEAFDHDGNGQPGGSLPKTERESAPAASATPTYDEAMAQRAAGTLKRSVLTEKGWVTPAAQAE